MSKEVAIIESINPVEVFKAGGIDPIIKAIREEVVHDVPDVSTKKGRDQIASRAYKVRQSKTYLDKAGKELADKLNAQLKPINAERKKAREELDLLAVEVREPLTQWEQAEQARKDAHESALSAITAAALSVTPEGYEKNVSELSACLAFIESVELGDHWEEFSEKAAIEKDSAIKLVKSNIELRQKYEDEQAELERLRKEQEEREQREREERIAREAAEAARIEAENKAREEAERVRLEAIERERQAKAEADRIENERLQAIRDKEEAERRAILAAEESARREKEAAERAERERQEAVERERRLAEDREAARIRHEQQVKAQAEEADRVRKANIEHRRSVNNEIVSALVAEGLTEEQAKNIVVLAASNSAGRLKIDY